MIDLVKKSLGYTVEAEERDLAREIERSVEQNPELVGMSKNPRKRWIERHRAKHGLRPLY